MSVSVTIEMFKQQFADIFIFEKPHSEIHQHNIHNYRLLIDCTTLHMYRSLQLPYTYKTTVLTDIDYNNLRATHGYLYCFDEPVTHGQMTRTTKIYIKLHDIMDNYVKFTKLATMLVATVYWGNYKTRNGTEPIQDVC